MDFRRVANNPGAVGEAIGRNLGEIKQTFDIDFGRRDFSVQGRRFPFLSGISEISFNRRDPEGPSLFELSGYSPMETGRKAHINMVGGDDFRFNDQTPSITVTPSSMDIEDFPAVPMLGHKRQPLSGLTDRGATHQRWGTTLHVPDAPHALSRIEGVMDAMREIPVSQGTLQANQRSIMDDLRRRDRLGLSPEEIGISVLAPGAKNINDIFGRTGAFHMGTGRFRFVSEERNAKIRASK